MRRVGGFDDRVLGEVAGEQREPGQRQRADAHHRKGDRDLAPQAAHLADVLLVVHRVDHRARTKEQQRLEEGVGEQVEDADRIGPCPHRHEHVAELRTGRVRHDPLDVVLDEADGCGEERRGGADQHDDGLGIRRQFEQRRQPRHHEHAGGDHGRGMDQGRDRGRAFHGVRQPGVQQELGRFAHGAHEQQQAGQRQRVGVPAEEVDGLAGEAGGAGEDGVEVGRADQREHREDAQRETEIADAVDHERLDGGGVGRRLLEPEPDQQVAGEAHPFPAEEQLHQVVGRHQHQHGEGEQRQVGHEPRAVRIVAHVADRIEVDERGHRVDDHQHDRGQGVDTQRPGDIEIAGIDPGQQHDAGIVMHEADIDERHPRQRGRDQQQRGGDQFGGARPGSRRLDRVIVMSVILVRMVVMTVIVMGDGGMGAMVVVTMIHLVATRVARMRAEDRDQTREDRAQQWQENNGLNHLPSALHQIDVFDRDRTAVAIEHHQHGQADRRFRRRHGQHQQREHLSDDVIEERRERHQVDVDGEQDQLDRHQDDDDVLAVEENAENAQREQDGGNRQIVSEPDRHRTHSPASASCSPCPDATLRTSMAISLVRAFCTGMLWRLTLALCRSVSTMAPIMATSSTAPANWK